MRSLEDLLNENNLSDSSDIDALLELAEITREVIHGERYTDIELLISYTVNNGYYEAFSWIMAVLQEEFDKKDNCRLKDFTCFIGRSIVNYDVFINRLQVDLKAYETSPGTIAMWFGIIAVLCGVLAEIYYCVSARFACPRNAQLD